MKVLITSGGTRVPIDTIRHIGNHSGGRTGAEIAKTAWEMGYEVKFLHAKGSQLPWDKDLVLTPQTSPAEFSSLVSKLDHWRKHTIQVLSYRTLTEYQDALFAQVAKDQPDVVILAAAVSDYTCEAQEGKIQSASATAITLKPATKIIGELRKKHPTLPIFGFKNLVNETEEELIEAAYSQILKHKLVGCIANLTPVPNDVSTWKTFLVTPEKTIVTITRSSLADTLMAYLSERLNSHDYSKTKINNSRSDPLAAQTTATLCQKWAKYSLFEPYQTNSPAEFGFVAQRFNSGMLITTRGSSKSKCQPSNIVYVTSEDGQHLECSSGSAKQTRNANIAWHIFKLRPEINYIVHTHIQFLDTPHTLKTRAPGTASDWQELQPQVQAGHDIIGQDLHGSLLLLKEAHELEEKLLQHNLFAKNPVGGYYETAYSRFKNSKLADLVAESVPKTANILDLAAGTGYLTHQLFTQGFRNLTAADPSRHMICKITDPVETRVYGFEDFSQIGRLFDVVTIRQAINYQHPTQFTQFFKELERALKPNGLLIFDTFTYNGQVKEQLTHTSQTDTHRLVTTESNVIVGTIKAAQLTGDIIYHSQITHAWPKLQDHDYHKIYDFNRFYGYTPENLEGAFSQNGYRLIKKITEGKSLRYVYQRK